MPGYRDVRSTDGRTSTSCGSGGAIGTSFDGGDTSMIAPGMLDGGGWMTLDGAAFLASDGTLSIWRSEATLGLHVTEDLRAILALKAEEWPGSTAALTLRPSIVLRVSDRISLQTGVTAGLRGSDTFGLSLSLWQEF